MPDHPHSRSEEDRRDDPRGSHGPVADEVRSQFVDEEARAHRGNDERQDSFPYGGERDHASQDHGDASQDHGDSDSSREERPWRDDRGFGVEPGAQQQSGQYGQGGQYGSSTYDRGSYGRSNERDGGPRGDEETANRAGEALDEKESGGRDRGGR